MDSFENGNANENEPNASRFAAWILGVVAILIPIFFLPSSAVSLPVAKFILLSVGVLASLAAVILSAIQNGAIKLPWNLMPAAIVSIPLVFLIASLFSPPPNFSLWGYGFETGTFGFVFLASVAALLIAGLFKKGQKQSTVLWGLLVVSLVLGLFHIARFIFGAGTLSLGFFSDALANTIGGWNELSIWFGLISILSVIILELAKPVGGKRIIAYAALVVSVVIMVLINFKTAWYLSGIFALIFLVYELSRPSVSPDGSTRRKIAWHAFGVVVLALVCILASSAISTGISQKLGLGTVEVRPSWVATWDVLRSSLSENVLVGVGANNFSMAWLTHKPAGINDTLFWNTDFTGGIGLIPTFAVTTCVLGILAWIFFLVLVVRHSIKLLFGESASGEEKAISVSAIFGTLFLWTVAVVYVPSTALFVLAFFFTGLLGASLYKAGHIRSRTLSLFAVPKASFISVLILIVVLIGVVSLAFLFVERAIAQVYFGKALLAANQEANLDNTENYLNRAIALSPFDTFYRSLSSVAMTRLSALLQDQNASADAVRAGFQSLFSAAVQNAQLATQTGPLNYQNWFNLAQIYQSVVPRPFQIGDAYDSAKAAFSKAKELNPFSPAIVLSMARLESDNDSLDAAANLAEEATKLKSNYADAHFFLSQIAVQQGNIQRAIEKTQTTILLSPQNAGLYFQLGVLYFNVPDYRQAVQALSQAIAVLPDYANARYFLGLSLARTGDKAGAIEQFETIQKTNPDNEEIKKVLSNLRAGKDPLSGISGAARQSLPVSGQ